MNPTILIVDDEIRYRELYAQVLKKAGFDIREAGSAEDALQSIRTAPPAMVISDVRMPGLSGIELLRQTRTSHEIPFLLVTAYADVRGAVDALKLGAVDYLAKPVDLDELLSAVRDTLGRPKTQDDADLPSEALFGIVLESQIMRSVFRDAYRVAKSDATILLCGESGSGKEVLAQFIHRHSKRSKHPLVAVNCAAIAPSLLPSELFGHEKGAFTGAVAKRKGHFREAHDGTLFLDEIGDMPLELQAALLRATETGRITPVGSDHELSVDCRLIAATNRHLADDVAAGRFRQDLYYRLNVISIEIPPLRERTEDILPLARWYLSQGKTEDRRLSRAAAQALLDHSWPGNVRELANAMAHVRLLSQTDVILPEHLPPAVRKATAKPAPIHTEPDIKTLDEQEQQAVARALHQTGGNRTKAAELLGITRRGLLYKLKRLGLE